ncbi:MAG: bile acid:sodium symporter family protein [Paludibacteraceae bacterium]|nr:bile acid:sodium symporter family protein [Paludibacteraceae bacterium]MCR5568037.1 bile acid:sodium symporter family protein [Paludibacteraceae bacterium]
MKQVCSFIAKWMGAIVLLLAIAAYLRPSLTDIFEAGWITPLLGVIMFGMGLTLEADDFKVVFSHPKDIVIGCIAQLAIMPGIAWSLAHLFNLPPELAIGVILVGCCPGGTASNLVTYLAKGDVALSVGMTGCSTLLAPILTPFLVLQLAGKSVEVEALGMLLSILEVVIVPIVAGFLVKHFFPNFTQRAVSYLPAFSSLSIATIVFIIIGKNSDKLQHCGLLIIAVVALHNLLGLLLGFCVGKLLGLKSKKCTAISIEVGMQNSGLASSLANLHFAAYPLAVIPGAIFSVWHNLSGALVAKIYAAMNEKAAHTDSL